MKKIYIVGGGGFARECHLHLKEQMSKDSSISFGGFLGHNGNVVDAKTYSNLFLGDVSEHEFVDGEYAVIGVGNVEIRKRIFLDLKSRGIPLYTLILGGGISDTVKYGEGNIFIGTYFTSEITIGDGNLFNGDVIVGHDCSFGDFNFIAPRSTFLGGAKIGSENSFGTACVIMPNAKVGNGNKISPLSVVYRGCRNNCYIAGNPALKIGDVQNG